MVFIAFLTVWLGAKSVSASPSSDFRSFVESLPEKVKAIDHQVTPDLHEEKRAELLKKVLKLQSEVEAAEKSFPSVMNAFVATAKTPAVKYLQQQNEKVKADLATLLGTADETESALKNDGLQFTERGLISEVQGYMALRASQNAPEFGIELFELLVAKSEIAPRYLELLHFERFFNGNKSVTQEAYFYLDQKFKAASLLLRNYFPLTPDFALGNLSRPEDVEKAYAAFMQNFVDGRGRFPPESTQKHIAGLVRRVMISQNDMEFYRQRMFPKAAADAQVNQLLASISEVPGSDQCHQLASGMAAVRYDGAVCRPAQFYQHLNKTINTYSRVAEPGLLVHIMEYVAEYRNGEYGDITNADSKEKAWEKLKKNISGISTSLVADNLVDGWKSARAMLTTGKESEYFRSLVDSEMEGVEVLLNVRGLLMSKSIGMRPVGNGWVVAGTIRDYTPEIDAVKEVKVGFQENVIAPLNEYRLKEDLKVKATYEKKLADFKKTGKEPFEEFTEELLNEALLETLESRLVVLDSSGRWCSVVNDTTKPFAERAQKSPWVITSRGAVDHKAVVSNSSNGFQKLSYFSTAKIANVVSIQNSDRQRKMFAGIAVRTAVGSILPNIVQARMLMQDSWGEEKKYDLDSLGVKLNDTTLRGVENATGIADDGEVGVMKTVNSKYNFPAYSQIVKDSREAWDDMLKRWAKRSGKFDVSDEELAGLDEDQRRKLIETRFRHEYKHLYTTFIDNYRTELEAAARLAQRWDKDIASLRKEPPKSAPDIFDQFGKSEFRESFMEAASGQTLVLQHMHEWIILFRRTVYLKSKDAKYRAMHPNELRRIAYAMKEEEDPKIDITYQEFMEEFRLNGQHLLQGDVSLWRAYMGYDSGRDIGVRPGELQEIFQLVMSTREKRLEALEYARNLVLFRFPQLRLNEAYKTYRGGAKDFQRVMTAYYQNAVDQANRFYNMGAMRSFDYVKQVFIPLDGEDQQAQHIIDGVMTNVPLLDAILKNFPDQLAFICSEQGSRDLWEKRVDVALASANGVGAVLSMASLFPIPGATLVGLVGVGISVAASGAQYMRARAKWYELEAARSWAAAAAPQLGFEADVRNWDYLNQMQKEADAAYYLAAIEASVTVATAGLTALSYHRAAKLASVATGSKVTAGQLLVRDLKELSTFTAKTKDAILGSFQRARWVSPETVGFRMRFMRAFQPLTYSTEPILFSTEKAAQALLYGGDEMNQCFWRMFGMRWADSTRAVWAQRGILGGGVALMGRFYVNYASEFTMARQVSYAYDDPEHNKAFLEAVEGGWLSHDQLRVAMEASSDYSKRVTDKASALDDLLAELSKAEKEGNGSVAEAKKNLRAIYDELAIRVTKLPPDSGEAVAVRRELKFIERMVKRWGA